jgi:aryl-alcohol dehydrogenase-like predicted oxidoreductase
VKYRAIGNTDLRASEIGLGCWAIGGRFWGPVDDSASVATIRRAREIGVNFFDTADSYGDGHSESLLGRVLEESGPDAIVCSKAGIRSELSSQDFSEPYLTRAVEGSLLRLRRGAIDLFLLHNPDRSTIERAEIFQTAERLKRAGKVRHWGISVRPSAGHWKTPASGATPDPVDDALAALKLADPSAIEIVFNIFESDAAGRLFAEARKRGTGIIARVPLASGLLSGKFKRETEFPRGDFRRGWPREQLNADVARVESLMRLPAMKGRELPQAALAFALSFENVSVVIPGARTPAQIEQNAAASDAPHFDALQLNEILAVA